MAYIARASGKREPITTPVSLKQAQIIVGGYVERVCPKKTPGVIFLCDEEGLLKHKPLNEHGCLLYGTEIHGQPIVGDILVFENRKDAKGWV